MGLFITRIVRKGKFHTRIETSDNKQLVVDNSPDPPYVGQQLDIPMVEVSTNELRPLKPSDPYPELVGSFLD